jgi:rhamnose utilization protein RhaD (predicted bifunctional aldolase and dehydrogenase)
MTLDPGRLKSSVTGYCASIGADRLLVQGAGGNVSWKDADTLWVKASGAWLEDAADKDIFAPVDLAHLRNAFDRGDFTVVPKLRGTSQLRPSIETLLHGLMPQPVVAHLHAVEVLAHMVRADCETDIRSLLGDSLAWTVVDYHTPGAALAAAVARALAGNPKANVIFLKNHGVVIGGEDVAEVARTLESLIRMLGIAPKIAKPYPQFAAIDQYVPAPDTVVHQLALDTDLFNRLDSSWALFPDHVVFLGPRAYTYKTRRAFDEARKTLTELPELVFIHGQGVFERPGFNQARQAQLRCYYEVLARQAIDSPLAVLTHEQIAELLNWDAEKYRKEASK